VAEAQGDRSQAERLGYEPVDVNIARLLWIALGWSIFVGLAALALTGLVVLFETLRPPSSASPLARVEILPPEPRLEANPKVVLDQVRRREDQLLNGYAWVDRDAGIARIPIDRAMAVLAERGWPKPPAQSPKAGETGK
jgi:hypothetical protein